MKAHKVSDKELIGRYLQGDHNSLEIIISRHKNRIYAYILMITKNKELADDLFQDTFIKVINTIRVPTMKKENFFSGLCELPII